MIKLLLANVLIVALLALLCFARLDGLMALSGGRYTGLTDKFVSVCLQECRAKKADLPDCNRESMAFIVRQYNLAAGASLEPGETYYPCTDVVSYYNCKEWRSKQLHDLCPATVEKSGMPWTDRPSRR